jgi:hypothetical protein
MRYSWWSKIPGGLAALIGLTAFGVGEAAGQNGSTASHWNPHRTRAFIVCLARFKGEKTPSFTTDDRLDGWLVEALKKRGVPAEHIVFLQDHHAAANHVRAAFTAFLHKSQLGETLLFYFGSHGSFDPKTGEYSFLAFDDSLPMTWAFDAIERDFKGSQALLFADCCYSGGLIELARKRRTHIAYGCLSSTYAHQTASSGWRFIQCLIRGLEGSPVVARPDREEIDLADLAHYTGHYMAFCAEGKPTFVTTGGLSPHLGLTRVTGHKKDPQVGRLLEVKSRKGWWPAEVIDVQGKELKIHFTEDTRTKNDRWVGHDATRPYAPPHFKVGAKVEVQSTCGQYCDKWVPATVVEAEDGLYFCRPIGLPAAYDGWFGPSGIRRHR